MDNIFIEVNNDEEKVRETGILFHKEHGRYLTYFLHTMPLRMISIERLLVAFFSVSGLEVLNKLDSLKDKKQEIIEWLYALQLTATSNVNLKQCGFQGSSFLAIDNCSDFAKSYQTSHIAMTYSALCTLLTLGDDLSRVDKRALLIGTRSLQQPNGSFSFCLIGGESDMRFVYCATCICYILNDWSGMDCQMAQDYIKNSLSYDGAFGQGPGLESHGGSTFCAIASLVLMGKLHHVINEDQQERLKRWCIMRQEEGFQGRPNKTDDTCYSFWIGGTLKLLNALDWCDLQTCRTQVLSTQDPICGGMAKSEGIVCDPLHTYLGLAGLSIAGTEKGLLPVHPALNISQRAADRLHCLHQKWSQEKLSK